MNAIVYTSNTSTTAQYAKLLGDALHLPVYAADAAKSEVSEGAEILYLGWLMASEIKGYKAAARRYRIRAVCGVGMGKTGTQIAEARTRNAIPENVPVFTLQGGFDLSKLRGIYKLMMRVMIKTAGKALANKTDRTPEENDMLEMMLHGGSRVGAENLKDILDWYKTTA